MFKKITLTIILSLFLLPRLAQASSTQGVSISPQKTELEVEAGEVLEKQLKITNLGTSETVFNLQINNYLPQNEERGIQQFLPREAGVKSHSSAQWIEIDQLIYSLKPNQSETIPFTVRVPAYAEPGSHYAIIFVSNTPVSTNTGSNSTGSTNISVSSQVGALFLITVKGDVQEKLMLSKFKPSQKIAEKLPIDFLVYLENQGNVHSRPFGEITIYDKNDDVLGKLSINEEAKAILPEITEKFDAKWQDKDLPIGKYKAELSLAYGNPQQTLAATTYFWIFPWKMATSIIIGLLILITAGIYGIKKYNKWIIKKALKKMKKEE